MSCTYEDDSNLFWVAFQSNILADIYHVNDDFKNSFEEIKKELTREGWTLPIRQANMRNQVNIANISVAQSNNGRYEM